MGKRYSIVGRRRGESDVTTICEVDANPMPLAHIAAMRRVFIGLIGTRKAFANKFESVRVIDRVEGKSWNIPA